MKKAFHELKQHRKSRSYHQGGSGYGLEKDQNDYADVISVVEGGAKNQRAPKKRNEQRKTILTKSFVYFLSGTGATFSSCALKRLSNDKHVPREECKRKTGDLGIISFHFFVNTEQTAFVAFLS